MTIPALKLQADQTARIERLLEEQAAVARLGLTPADHDDQGATAEEMFRQILQQLQNSNIDVSDK